MMLILQTVAVLASLAALTAPALARQVDERTVPVQFRGEWNERREDCGTGNNDSRLRIEAATIDFYESGGRVRGAFLNGPYEIIIVADLSGEGSTWMDSFQFTLAADGSYLSTRSEGGTLTRYRCPLTSSTRAP